MPHEHCQDLLGSLSEYVDGDLGAEFCSQLERHLEGCENCRIVVDSLRKTVYLYHVTAEAQEVPQDVRLRLYRRLNLDDLMK